MARIDDVRDLAVKVMGWECQDFDWLRNALKMKRLTGERCCWWEDINADDACAWDPYKNSRAALEVVEAMEDCGYWMRAEKTKDGYYVRFNKIGDMSRWAAHMSTSFCEAICTAALAAIREGQ